jgi:hypothetical protein
MTKITLTDFLNDFEPVPEDRYDIECVKTELTQAKTGAKSDMISAQFKILSPHDFSGQILFDNFVLSEKSIWKLASFMKAGKSELLSKPISYEEIARGMVGLRVSVYSTPGETPSGNSKNVLSKYNETQHNYDTKTAESSSKTGSHRQMTESNLF